MQDINLRAELEKAQQELEQNRLIREVETWLSFESVAESDIAHRIQNERDGDMAALVVSLLDQNKIFDLQTIEAICTRFRLRFLESTMFKGDIPAEAIRRVKRMEAATGLRFERFRIIAPAERFHLKDSTKDPILMLELPNNRYYFIYQWGSDMKWYQHFLKYPFRHMGTLAITSITLGLLISLLVPSQFESIKAEFFYRFFMFSMSSALVMTLAIIVGIMYSKDFSENVWNSRFIR